MKYLLKTLMIAGIFLMSVTAFGQVKLGHINSSELLKIMPEVKQADTQLQSFAKQLQDKEQELYAEYQKKMMQLQTDTLVAKSVQQSRYDELVDMQQRIKNFQDKAQQDLVHQKEKLYNPIIAKAETAIKEVAKENGYKYIFDTSMGNVLYFEETDDVMVLVKKKLNIP